MILRGCGSGGVTVFEGDGYRYEGDAPALVRYGDVYEWWWSVDTLMVAEVWRPVVFKRYNSSPFKWLTSDGPWWTNV